jgi:hypothetical protein
MIHTCKDCAYWGRNDPSAVKGEGGRAARIVLALCQHQASPIWRDYARPYSQACREFAPWTEGDTKCA